MKRVITALIPVVFVLVGTSVSADDDLTVDQVLKKMSEKAETIKDIQAEAVVRKYDSIEEEVRTTRMELAYKKPWLAKLDTYRKIGGKEKHTQEVIWGEDFMIRVWPDQKHGEKRTYTAEQMARMRERRNDPLTFFTRKPEELQKDFKIEKLADFEKNRVVLGMKPKDDSVDFDYTSVELTIDTTTWLPVKIKAIVVGPEPGPEDDDWTVYDFKNVRVNQGLKDSFFKPEGGVKIEDVKE